MRSRNLLSVVLIVFALLLNTVVYVKPSSAKTDARSGMFDSGVEWSLNEDGRMTFSGYGTIPAYGIWEAFEDDTSECLKVKEIHIGSGISKIGFCLTDSCHNLKSISVDRYNQFYYSENDCVVSLDGTLVCGCPNSIIPDVKRIGFGAFSQMRLTKSMVIPYSVRSIACWAFGNSRLFEKLTIENPNIAIEESAFSEAYFEKGVAVNPGSPIWVENNTLVYDKKVVGYVYDCSSYVIPEGVVEVDSKPSCRCNVVSITFPQSLKTIGNGAFFGSGVSHYYFKSKNAPALGNNCFSGCNAVFHVRKDGIGYGRGGWEKLNVYFDIDSNSPNIEPDITPAPTFTPKPTIAPIPVPTLKPDYTIAPTSTPVVSNSPKPTSTPAYRVDFEDVSFSFPNEKEALGYSNKDLEFDSFLEFFGQAKASHLYSLFHTWEGECFGMSGCSLFMNMPEEDVELLDFNMDRIRSLTPGSINSKLSITLRKMIEWVFVSQWRSECQSCLNRNMDKMDELLKMSDESFEDNPYILCLFTDKIGHAINPIHLEGPFQVEGSTEKHKYKLGVYDNNYPDQIKYVEIIEKNNKVESFKYRISDRITVSSKNGGYMSWVDYKTLKNVWMNRKSKNKSSNAVFSTDNDSYRTYNEKGEMIVKKSADSGAISYRKDAYCYTSMCGGESAQQLVYLNPGLYHVESEDGFVSFTVSSGDYSVDCETGGNDGELLYNPEEDSLLTSCNDSYHVTTASDTAADRSETGRGCSGILHGEYVNTDKKTMEFLSEKCEIPKFSVKKKKNEYSLTIKGRIPKGIRFEIQIAHDRGFKKYRVVNLKKRSIRIKLKKGDYVRVRSYRILNTDSGSLRQYSGYGKTIRIRR